VKFLWLLSHRHCTAAVEARIRIGSNKFRQLVVVHYLPVALVPSVPLIRRGRLYNSCVQSSMLHGSETWPARKENEMALQWAEMRMVRWMYDGKVKDKVPCNELRKRETRNRWYNLGTTTKQVSMVWACVSKRRHWLGEEMHGVWSGALQTKRQTIEDVERGCEKRLSSR